VIEHTVKRSTHHSYQRNIRLHVIPYVGGLRLQHVDPGNLNQLFGELLVSGNRGRPGTGLKPKTVRYIRTILRRALKDAVRWERLTRNPVDATDPPRDDTASTNAARKEWNGLELGEFLDRSAAEGDRYYPAWMTLATTGMRRGEMLGLRWSDVDLDRRVATIRQTLIVVNHHAEFGTPKTKKGARTIDLDLGTVEVLRSLRKRQVEERLAMGQGWPDHDLVFTHADGRWLHPERFSREFDRRVERYGLTRLTVHGLRHTWGSLALKAGVHPKVVQERLGHATIGVTMDIYSHVGAGMQRDAAETVANMIDRRSTQNVTNL
jgi:integrase